MKQKDIVNQDSFLEEYMQLKDQKWTDGQIAKKYGVSAPVISVWKRKPEIEKRMADYKREKHEDKKRERVEMSGGEVRKAVAIESGVEKELKRRLVEAEKQMGALEAKTKKANGENLQVLKRNNELELEKDKLVRENYKMEELQQKMQEELESVKIDRDDFDKERTHLQGEVNNLSHACSELEDELVHNRYAHEAELKKKDELIELYTKELEEMRKPKPTEMKVSAPREDESIMHCPLIEQHLTEKEKVHFKEIGQSADNVRSILLSGTTRQLREGQRLVASKDKEIQKLKSVLRFYLKQ